jgi:hypothetical protein
MFLIDWRWATVSIALNVLHLSDGIEALAQCQGLGALRPNTVLLGWPTNADRAELFGSTLRAIASLERSIVVLRFYQRLEHWAGDLPRVVFVDSVGGMSLDS